MDGLNKVMLFGTLGADPELKFGQKADSAVLKLRLATNKTWFDKNTNEKKEKTEWHSVVVFGKRAEGLQKILEKGSNIFIEGELSTSSYEKDGQKHWQTQVIANNVILAGGKGKPAASTGKKLPGDKGFDPNAEVPEEGDSDIPF